MMMMPNPSLGESNVDTDPSSFTADSPLFRNRERQSSE